MSATFASLRRNWTAAVGLLLALALLAANFTGQSNASHNDDHKPANKLAVAGSGEVIEVKGDDLGDDLAKAGVTLLATTMKNPGSKALLISVTLECSILTDLLTAGIEDSSRAQATMEVWVEVNDEPVMYADDNGSEGKVTFCEREYQRETELFPGECAKDDPEDADEPDRCVIDDFIRTKASHGFNWVALHDGPGDKKIVVKANLNGERSPNAKVSLAVGARTLVVQPADVARNETLSN